MLDSLLRHLTFLDDDIERLNAEMANRVGSFDEDIKNVDAIPELGRRLVEQVIAEVGLDMGPFPFDRALIKGLVTGQQLNLPNPYFRSNESDGRRGQTAKSNPPLVIPSKAVPFTVSCSEPAPYLIRG
ncbi:MAG: hypothetical protein HYX85_02545 [Chloroflexi bacterium]|nr:hypothetical protein [Chloroflexota bacterium]